MSLTSILRHPDSKELREKFRNEFSRPEFKLVSDFCARPLTNNYGLVGTAFDYLLRFYIQYYNDINSVQRKDWIASDSYERLVGFLNELGPSSFLYDWRHDKTIKVRGLLNLLSRQYERTVSNYNKFLRNGKITDELVTSTIFLAKLDIYYRSGIIDPNFGKPDLLDIIDIRMIFSLVNSDHFTAKKNCFLNPTFGEGSLLVGGADADVIIDDMLIDIKTTKHLKLDRNHLNQLLGYYILSLIGGVNGNVKEKSITKIGIYFARHGLLWTVPIASLGNKRKFSQFKNWFVEHMNKEY